MSSWVPYRQQEFSGGENLKTLPEFLAPNQLSKAINCVLTADGLLQTRDGKTKINTTSLGTGPIISAHRYSKENGDQYLVVQHGTSLYAAPWNGTAPFTSFGTAIKTGLNPAKLRSVVWKDNLILTNGIDLPFRFDGTTCTNLSGTPPKSYIIKVYAGRLWLVDASNPNQIRFSGLETYNTWDVLDIIKVRDADGDQITGLAPVSGGMVILKRNSVFPLYGTSRDNLRIGEPIARYVGNQGYDSYVDDGFFLGKDNIYAFNLSSVTALPETHTPLIADMSASQRQSAIFQVLPKERRLFVYLGNTAKDTLCLEGRYNGAVTRQTNINAACFALADDKNDPGNLLIGDATNGIVYSHAGLTDDGTAITTTITHGRTDHGIPRDKLWRYFEPELEVTTDGTYLIKTTAAVDYERMLINDLFVGDIKQMPLVWGVGIWGQARWGKDTKNIKPRAWLHNLRGSRVAFTIETDRRIKYYGYETKYREVGQS